MPYGKPAPGFKQKDGDSKDKPFPFRKGGKSSSKKKDSKRDSGRK
jgi:hypothetical protein